MTGGGGAVGEAGVEGDAGIKGVVGVRVGNVLDGETAVMFVINGMVITAFTVGLRVVVTVAAAQMVMFLSILLSQVPVLGS